MAEYQDSTNCQTTQPRKNYFTRNYLHLVLQTFPESSSFLGVQVKSLSKFAKLKYEDKNFGQPLLLIEKTDYGLYSGLQVYEGQ
jgi:hypothetical protein